MKRWITGAVIALLMLAVCAWASAEASTTILVYMCGADIYEDACMDIYEMAEAEAGDDVNIVVLAGGAENWDYEELKAGQRNFFEIRDWDFQNLSVWPYKSMGSPESLQEFLEYGFEHYPADRMITILWDHGSGTEAGVCFDSTTRDEDGLTLVEINNALYHMYQKLGDSFHIDIFGCDACLMATYEMAAMLSNYNIDCFIGSEELEPGLGWSYTPWIKALDQNPDMTDEEICRSIATAFMDAGLADNPNDYLTLSAVSLPGIRKLTASMENFAAYMIQEVKNGNIAEIRRGRSRMYTFGSFDDASWDMVDMGAVLDAYASFAPESAAEARRLLAKSLIVSAQTDNLAELSGLAVLLPQDTTNEFDYYSSGFDFSAYIPNWVDFLNGYADLLRGSSYTFSASAPQQVTVGTPLTGITSFAYSPSGMTTVWNEETEEYQEVAAPEAEEYVVGLNEYGFTSVLTAEDMANLDYVEGMLLVDESDDEMTCFVDFGLMRNNLINWQTGEVVSLFDGTWPCFGDQMIVLYDQSSNENSRRSLIPVKLNGEYTYLLVLFRNGSTEGTILGANAGYDENGLPIRSVTKLKDGDKIIPIYTMYYQDANADEDADMEETEFEGDEIIWHEGMKVTYEDVSEEGESLNMLFCFVFNDIFGDSTMSDFIAFEL